MNKVSTPICDFVKKYIEDENVRLHMPGHKGKEFLGCEKWDITEINGADSLYEADGIILESEKNLSQIFGSLSSFYSTEGSSLCIRTMLYAALQVGLSKGKNQIVAARNVHKTFVYSAALLDFETVWLTSLENSLYSCVISPEELEKTLSDNDGICAVYVTSPDYLGNVADIKGLSKVCKRADVPLIVDNAHGAYLKFTSPSMHPLDLGVDMCCDSAHKTLPVLTGGAYLHVSKDSKYGFEKYIKKGMSLFASTSPSYIILQSLDRANMTVSEGFAELVQECAERVQKAKLRLSDALYGVCGDEPLKVTLKTKPKGYYGYEIAEILKDNNIHCECFDRDNLVLMFSPFNSESDFEKLADILCSVKTKTAISEAQPTIEMSELCMSPRKAIMSVSESVSVNDAVGRILASPSVSCPPAIPIAVCGERITEKTVACFKYYGINQIDVVK